VIQNKVMYEFVSQMHYRLRSNGVVSTRSLVLAVLAFLACATLTGCSAWFPLTVPMRMIDEPAQCAKPPETLLVMLPGAYSRPEDFVREGFVAAVRARRIAADLQLVDAHLGYYKNKSIVERLQLDVLTPAFQHGYKHVWIVGISIGAFGAMLVPALQLQDPNATQPADFAIDGIVALGPYLGQRQMSDEISEQGGLRSWRAPRGRLDPDDIDNILWRWLQQVAGGAQGSSRPALYLGYGRDDRFAFSDALLAAGLPADHVDTVPGGHEWAPWLNLWGRVLMRLPLPVDPSCIDK
jgi:hypothetical protein